MDLTGIIQAKPGSIWGKSILIGSALPFSGNETDLMDLSSAQDSQDTLEVFSILSTLNLIDLIQGSFDPSISRSNNQAKPVSSISINEVDTASNVAPVSNPIADSSDDTAVVNPVSDTAHNDDSHLATDDGPGSSVADGQNIDGQVTREEQQGLLCSRMGSAHTRGLLGKREPEGLITQGLLCRKGDSPP